MFCEAETCQQKTKKKENLMDYDYEMVMENMSFTQGGQLAFIWSCVLVTNDRS